MSVEGVGEELLGEVREEGLHEVCTEYTCFQKIFIIRSVTLIFVFTYFGHP